MIVVKEFFLVIWNKYKAEVVLLLSALIVLIISIFMYFHNSQAANEDYITQEDNPVFIKEKILIDLSGAIQKPDVYEVTNGARLKDVIALAHGLSYIADQDFFARNFNMARMLKDQEKIYIPSKYEIWAGIFKEPIRMVDLTQPQIVEFSPITTDKININKATLNELDSLPNIGKATAQKIIQNRPYSLLDDLLTKKVLNKSVYERIKDLISIN